MTPATTLKLGDFVFSDKEIPERIDFGGDQAFSQHDLVGGVRVIDAMGAMHAPLEWSGYFTGGDALARARYLDQLRMAGKPLSLTWSELRYTVLIQTVTASFELAQMIPYRIRCVVVSMDSAPVKLPAADSTDVKVAKDVAKAADLANKVGDPTLVKKVSALQAATKQISNFAKATQAQIASVLGPIKDVQDQTKTLLATAGNTLTSVATLGGIAPNSPLAKQVANLNKQSAAMQQTPLLLQLDSVTSRLSTNVKSDSSAAKTTPVAGGNLYKVAADAYGDPSEWATIAKANNMTDPTITGTKQIKVPVNASGNGGVLSA